MVLDGMFLRIYVFYMRVIFHIYYYIQNELIHQSTLFSFFIFHNNIWFIFLRNYRVDIFLYDILMGKDEHSSDLVSFSKNCHKYEVVFLYHIKDFYIFHKNSNIQAFIQNINIYIEDNSS